MVNRSCCEGNRDEKEIFGLCSYIKRGHKGMETHPRRCRDAGSSSVREFKELGGPSMEIGDGLLRGRERPHEREQM